MVRLIKDITPKKRKIAHEFVLKSLGAEEMGIKIKVSNNLVSLFALRQNLIEQLCSKGGRPTIKERSTKRSKVPFYDNDWETLKDIAKYYKEKDNINTTPGQIASILIHNILTQIPKSIQAEKNKDKKSVLK